MSKFVLSTLAAAAMFTGGLTNLQAQEAPKPAAACCCKECACKNCGCTGDKCCGSCDGGPCACGAPTAKPEAKGGCC